MGRQRRHRTRATLEGIPPSFFVSVETNELARGISVSEEAKGPKVICFDTLCGQSVSAENKGVASLGAVGARETVRELVQRVITNGRHGLLNVSITINDTETKWFRD